MKKVNYTQEAVQGDVVITKTRLPKGLLKVNRRKGRLILAEGEVTGHAHAITDMEAELWEDPINKELYLVAVKEVELVHEEHNTVTVQPGTYKVGIVKEYDYFLEESHKVVD